MDHDDQYQLISDDDETLTPPKPLKSHRSKRTNRRRRPPPSTTTAIMDHDDQYQLIPSDDEIKYPMIFEQQYVCHPFSDSFKFSHSQSGNRIVMPASALNTLSHLEIDYPMVFSINNPSTGKTSHCGVLEFVADEGTILVPNPMMSNLQLKKGQLVTLTNTSLPKATYIKIQPHKTSFINSLHDPKGVLECALKDFACLTLGDTISINHNHGEYKVDVVETEPANAVSVVETDCKVDFAEPLDYKPIALPPPTPTPKLEVSKKKRPEEEESSNKVFVPFTGIARRLDGQSPAPKVYKNKLGPQVTGKEKVDRYTGLLRAKKAFVAAEEEDSKSSFKPFTGISRRLNEQPKPQSKKRSSRGKENSKMSKKMKKK